MTVALSRGWYLYRIFDAAGDLIYIGISNDALRRFVEHLRTKRWAGEICDHIRDRRTFASEAAALAAERIAIIAERPRFNEKHNQGNPNRVNPQTMRFPDGRLYRPEIYHVAGSAIPTRPVGGRPPARPSGARRPANRRHGWWVPRSRAGRLMLGWAALAFTLWVAAFSITSLPVGVGAVGSAAMSAVVLASRPKGRRPRRRRWWR